VEVLEILKVFKKYTEAGVEKVILGSAAIKDKNFLKEACEKFPNKIALGLDAKDGYLSVSGGKKILIN
jgi:phosphoribosylformimino-5-aminoimidazole carboxamide ribotide isomerase